MAAVAVLSSKTAAPNCLRHIASSAVATAMTITSTRAPSPLMGEPISDSVLQFIGTGCHSHISSS